MNLDMIHDVPGCIGDFGYQGKRPEHEWSNWDDYAEGGITIITSGPRIGKHINFWEERQKRTCSKCGVRQDRIVKQEIR